MGLLNQPREHSCFSRKRRFMKLHFCLLEAGCALCRAGARERRLPRLTKNTRRQLAHINSSSQGNTSSTRTCGIFTEAPLLSLFKLYRHLVATPCIACERFGADNLPCNHSLIYSQVLFEPLISQSLAEEQTDKSK